jgi:predicted glycoside hydrolase/deacetylase ChbG (UPF0249 family)
MGSLNRERTIISADDFGISILANNNILELVRQRKIDRIEVMISPNLSAEEVEEIKNSGIKIDIHLHLIKADSDYWQGNRRFKEGAVKRLIIFVFNYIFRRTSPDRVELKWAIQIERFRELFGKTPDGIGSHEYIHFFPPYFRVALKLAERYSIPYIRLGNLSGSEENMVAKILNWLRRKNLAAFKRSKLSSSDYMVSLDWVEDKFGEFMRMLPEGSKTEVVCHPEREEESRLMQDKL